jgi:hypothetical protein
MKNTVDELMASTSQEVQPAEARFNTDLDRRMPRREAAAFLRDHGFPVAEGTLATKATRGGGPLYSIWSGRALYRVGDLLDWAYSLMTEPRRHTSESAGRRAA